MKPLLVQPEKHILVCVNEKETECCKKVGGENLYFKLKNFVKENNLVGRVWVTRTRCLGFCNAVGATIVIYPEGKWFTEVTENEFDNIIKELL